jgi:hypothetical protein
MSHARFDRTIIRLLKRYYYLYQQILRPKHEGRYQDWTLLSPLSKSFRASLTSCTVRSGTSHKSTPHPIYLYSICIWESSDRPMGRSVSHRAMGTHVPYPYFLGNSEASHTGATQPLWRYLRSQRGWVALARLGGAGMAYIKLFP